MVMFISTRSFLPILYFSLREKIQYYQVLCSVLTGYKYICTELYSPSDYNKSKFLLVVNSKIYIHLFYYNLFS